VSEAKYDPKKVHDVLRGYKAEIEAQELVADALDSLADDARREQYRKDSDYRMRVQAWREHGVEIPQELEP
jgi:preprotein translocase subunit Sec63